MIGSERRREAGWSLSEILGLVVLGYAVFTRDSGPQMPTRAEPESPVPLLLAEYSALRAEIVQRINNQFLAIGALGVTATAVVSIALSMSQADAAQLLLIVPTVFLLIGWLYYEQHLLVSQITLYLMNTLRPALLSAAGVPGNSVVLSWDMRRRHNLDNPHTPHRHLGDLGLAHLFRLALSLGVGAVCLATGLRLRTDIQPHVPWHFYIVAALALEAALALSIVVTFGRVTRNFFKIAHPSKQ